MRSSDTPKKLMHFKQTIVILLKLKKFHLQVDFLQVARYCFNTKCIDKRRRGIPMKAFNLNFSF